MRYEFNDVSKYVKECVEQNGSIALVAEPGDATRYELWITRVNRAMASIGNIREGSHLVTCLNLGNYPATMLVHPHQFVFWKDIRDKLGITAEGSAYFITVLLAYYLGTFYEPYDTFIAKLEQESSRM